MDNMIKNKGILPPFTITFFVALILAISIAATIPSVAYADGEDYGSVNYGGDDYGSVSYGYTGNCFLDCNYSPTSYTSPFDYGSTNYGSDDYGSVNFGSNTPDYGSVNYGGNDYGSVNYGGEDYGSVNYGCPTCSTVDYGSVNYGSNLDYGSVNYGTPDYGSVNYGTPDYGSVNYGTPDYGSVNYGSFSSTPVYSQPAYALYGTSYAVGGYSYPSYASVIPSYTASTYRPVTTVYTPPKIPAPPTPTPTCQAGYAMINGVCKPFTTPTPTTPTQPPVYTPPTYISTTPTYVAPSYSYNSSVTNNTTNNTTNNNTTNNNNYNTNNNVNNNSVVYQAPTYNPPVYNPPVYNPPVYTTPPVVTPPYIPPYVPPIYNQYYPTCTLNVSQTNISRGQAVTLSWYSNYTTGGTITYVGSVSTNGSITVYPNQTTTYTGTFWGQNGQQVTCSATVSVNYYAIAYTQPATPYVSLSTVPYTGLDLGPVGAVIYWSLLILMCLVAAYLVAVRRVQNDIARSVKNFLFGSSEVAVVHTAEPTHKASEPIHIAPAAPRKAAPVGHFAGADEFILSQIHRTARI